MSIDSLRSGAIRICFDPSLNAYKSKCRILIEGQKLDTGTAVSGELLKIPSLRDADLLFGEGSIIAEGLKTAFACCPNHAMEFYALPWDDADMGAIDRGGLHVDLHRRLRKATVVSISSWWTVATTRRCACTKAIPPTRSPPTSRWRSTPNPVCHTMLWRLLASSR